MAKPATQRADTARPKRGRPLWEPNDDQRRIVTALSGRESQETIARVLGISVETLVKHCPDELAAGQQVAYAHIEGALFKEAMAGNVTAIIWYEKSRRKYREVTAHEHTGRDGAPIEMRDMSRYTDEQLELLAQAATLLGGAAGDGSGES